MLNLLVETTHRFLVMKVYTIIHSHKFIVTIPVKTPDGKELFKVG